MRTNVVMLATMVVCLVGCERNAATPNKTGVAQQALIDGGYALTVSDGGVTFVGGGQAPAVIVDPALTIEGADPLTGASVSISSGFTTSDRLAFAAQPSITGSYDTSRGILTLTGSASPAEYQAALRTVTFGSASTAPTAGTRAVTFTLGSAQSNPANGHAYQFISFNSNWSQARDDAATRRTLGMQGYLATITSQSETDFVLAKLAGDGWIGAAANPETGFPRTWSWATGPENGMLLCDNQATGDCAPIGGAYNLWAGGEPNDSGGEGCAQIYFGSGGAWNDLPCANTLGGYVIEYGGSAGDAPQSLNNGTREVNVTFTATTMAVTAGTLIWNQGSGPQIVDPGFTAAGSSTLNTATVRIVTGFLTAQDRLAFTNANGITGVFNTATGILTLTGPATIAAYQAAFRTVTYANIAATPTTATVRAVRYTLGSFFVQRQLQVRLLPTVTLSAPSPRVLHASNTLTATITPSASTGTVEFFADGISLGSSPVASGSATKSATLAVGTHALSAVYSGDTQRTGATGTASQTITTIGLGQGPCATGAECASGLCNTTSSTCAVANQSACTANNQCMSSVCGSNSLCGITTGGACTSAAQCQAGGCSTNNNTCIPAGGCAVAADCSPGEQCNATSNQCEIAPGVDSSAGTTIYDAMAADVVIDPSVMVVGSPPIAAATVTIGTGFDNAHDALIYATVNGIAGSYDATTGILSLTGSASAASYQSALRTVKYGNTGGAFPNTAARSITFAIGTAVANGSNGHFYEYVAQVGSWNNARTAAAARRYLGLKGYLATLTSAAENDFVAQKLSDNGWMGAQANPEITYPRIWSWVTGPEAGTPICDDPGAGGCTPINNAYTRWDGSEPNNQVDEGCGMIYFANAGSWNDLPCGDATFPGYVVEFGGSVGDPVVSVSDSKSLQVRAKTSISVDASLRSAALHDAITFIATFTPSTATGSAQFSIDGAAFGAPVAITAGVASMQSSAIAIGSHTITVSYGGDTTDQAASGDGGSITVTSIVNGAGPCASGADCTSGACSTTGTCGLVVNEGPCTAGSTSTCQSGLCSLGGACMPSSPGGCFVDADCGAASFCDRSTNLCTSTASAGSPIPDDGLHDGVCHDGLSSVCQGGACNVVTNTCSTAVGGGCVSASQCASNACSPNGNCIPTAPGSCWIDAECPASSFCNRAALSCTAQLVSGASIPDDGLHGGSCSMGVQTCATGRCNQISNTCASSIGSTCVVSTECEFGTCSQGKCGIATGETGCDSSTAYLCQSGACSTSGSCIPPSANGCFIDSDCDTAHFCDRASFTCVSRGVAGAALPNDGVLHDGVCASRLAQATCSSGLCNAVSNTCAEANTVACTDASACVSNICGTDGNCGHPVGEGPCTAANANTVCQHGFCNASANGNTSACVPSSTGCWIDDDCASDSYCARNTFTCTPLAVAGDLLPIDGLHGACGSSGVNAACASGLCNAISNTCAVGNDQPCTEPEACVSNACGSNGKCGLANGDATCTAIDGSTICQSGACAASGVCAPGGGCFVDSDCSAAQYCNRSTLTCSGKLLAGAAIPTDGLHTGSCDATGVKACVSGQCNATTNTCAANQSAGCATDRQCVSNVCGSNGECGLASGQSGCTPANASACQSGACSSAGVCVEALSGSCWVDADCSNAQHCRRDQMLCVADGAAGASIASDTLHDGICSTATAQAVCISGSCNAAKNTCAVAIGVTCATAAECVVDVCGTNGQCGLATGQGECAADSADRCQSGACSSNGTCMPSAGCSIDADCTGAQFCERSSNTCRGKRAAGSTVSACTDASSMCLSGSCNASTLTCGEKNGVSCSAPNECESNVCGVAGACGTTVTPDPGTLTGGAGCSSTGADPMWMLLLVFGLGLTKKSGPRRGDR